MQKKIEKDLLSLADEEYRKFHSSLCPNTQNIIGIRVPILKEYAKNISRENWKEYLENAKDDYYEETLLQGIVIGKAKMSIEETFKYLKIFIPKINNWAVCDTTCSGLKIAKKYLKEMLNFLKPYLSSNKEFEIRFVIVMLLDYYIQEKYIDEVLNILNNIKHEGYYVKMAIAWCISFCYIKQKDKTIIFLKNNKLDKFTFNKAIQKIIESNRVSKEEKDILKGMKI